MPGEERPAQAIEEERRDVDDDWRRTPPRRSVMRVFVTGGGGFLGSVRINFEGAVNLVEAMRACGVRRAIHISSEETYGEFRAGLRAYAAAKTSQTGAVS
jgi:hypothetical protein